MECPHCGARVPRRARACHECGSDEDTGWAPEDEIDYQSIDFPDACDSDAWEAEAEGERVARGRRALVATVFVVALLGGALAAAFAAW